MPEVTRARLRELERIHLLRTLVNYGPMTATRVAEVANGACDDEAFDGLPEISARAIAGKLNGLSIAGLVTAEHRRAERVADRVLIWRVTKHGEQTAAAFAAERSAGEGRA